MSEINILSLAVIQIVVLILIVLAILVMLLKFKHLKVFLKLLLPFVGLGLAFIIAFAAAYTLIIAIDFVAMQNIAAGDNISLSDWIKKLPNEEVSKLLHFAGLNIQDYIDNRWLLISDMLYFSTMTFFTVGYGDIAIKGIFRLLPMIGIFGGQA